MTADATRRARRNKRLGWASEKRAAEIFGTKRYPANTGGPCDLIPVAGHHIQVKAGGTMTIATIFEGLDAGRRSAAPEHGLGACYVEYHRGNRVRSFICFDPREYASWIGIQGGKDETEAVCSSMPEQGPSPDV